MLFEILFVIFHPNALFSGKYFAKSLLLELGIRISFSVYYYHDLNIEYEINHLMTLIMHLRIIFLVRTFLYISKYSAPRVYRLRQFQFNIFLLIYFNFFSKIYGSVPGYLFTLKCLIKVWPITTLMTSLFISILFFGSLIRICERPLEIVEDATTNNHFGFYENSFWFTMVTLTTG